MVKCPSRFGTWHKLQIDKGSPQESSFHANNVIDQNASLVQSHHFIIEGCNPCFCIVHVWATILNKLVIEVK